MTNEASERLKQIEAAIPLAASAESLEALRAERAAILKDGNGLQGAVEAAKDAIREGARLDKTEARQERKVKALSRKVEASKELAAAVEKAKSGADPFALGRELAPFILSDDIELDIAREAVAGASASPNASTEFLDGFEAGKADAGGSEVPHLSHKDPQKSADAFLSLIHEENGTRLLHRFQGDYYRWAGTHYEAQDEPMVENQVWRFLPKGNLKPNMARVANVMRSISTTTHLANALRPPCWLGNPDPTYPDTRRMVPLLSGILNADNLALHESTPRLFYRSCLPFHYDPEDATHPPTEWLKFLDTLWGKDAELDGFRNDPQAVDCLQEMMGYLLTSDTSLQKMLLVVGPKRSGKGTIARVISELLGAENVWSSDFPGLSGDHGTQGLLGKSLLVIPDAMRTQGADLNRVAEILKMISGEDPVVINPKNKPLVSARLPLHVLMFSNLVPSFADASSALSGRFIVLSMTRSFYGKEDLGLEIRLRPELPRILHWALEGRRRLYKRGYFISPDSSREVVDEMEEQSSPVLAFINDRCTRGPAEKVEVPRLWEMWRDWCRSTGSIEGRLQWFGRDIRAVIPGLVMRKETRGMKRIRVYVGIGEELTPP